MRAEVVASATVGLATLAAVAAAVLLYRRRKRIPTRWRQVGVLDKIFTTPIKSGFLSECDEMVCQVEGLRQGRHRDRLARPAA